jgi:HNH endonuclease
LESKLELLDYFSYDKDTGHVYRMKKTSKFCIDSYKKGPVGTRHKHGYLHVKFKNKQVKVHRLAWFLHYREWPKYQIDHINGIRDDNRIDNLRDVERKFNANNRVEHREGKLPYANYDRRRNSWSSYIHKGSKKIHLGTFKSMEEAHTLALFFTEEERTYENS